MSRLLLVVLDDLVLDDKRTCVTMDGVAVV